MPQSQRDEILKQARGFYDPFRIDDGGRFHLSSIDPGDTVNLDAGDKPGSKGCWPRAWRSWPTCRTGSMPRTAGPCCLIFQAMDAAGKDCTIKHVISGVNPQGCQFTFFKAPSALGLDHDYLRRCNSCRPERGRMGIYNRSCYEETPVVRVHPEMLASQSLPTDPADKGIWQQRYRDIRQ